jgi:hypothetical protein
MTSLLRLTKTLRIIVITAGLGLGTGCAHQYAPDARFGQSIREHLTLQTKTPGGVGHNRLAPGFEGAAARSSVDAYVKSFEAPKPTQDALKLGVGVVRESNGAR